MGQSGMDNRAMLGTRHRTERKQGTRPRGTFKKKEEYIDFHTSQLKELAPESSLFSVFVGPCCSPI
jgi:phage/plasmid-associated DNA primase